MTEEIKTPETGVQPQSEERQFTPVEQEAMEQGWVPKEEFSGDEGKWVDAGEFVRRGELFKKIDAQSREVKTVRRALEEFKQHYSKVKETEYQHALRDLKREYKLANREGDFEKADALEEQIESVEKEKDTFVKEQKQVVTEAAEIHPEFASWVGRNSWYASEPHMKVFADRVGLKYAELGMTPSEVLKKVDKAVRDEFPTKFKNPNQERPGSVEGSTAKGGTKKDSFENTLSDQERRVMDSFVKGGVMKKEEYLADLKKIKGVA